MEEICAEAAKLLQLPERELLLYLRTNIDFTLDAENLKGLLTYFGHCSRLGLIERMNPVSIVGRPDSPPRIRDSAASATHAD